MAVGRHLDYARSAANSGRRSLGEATDLFERMLILRGLENANYNQTRAAELLGTTRRILKYKIDKLGIPTNEQ